MWLFDFNYTFLQIIGIMDIIRAPNIEDMKDVYPLKTRWELQVNNLA